MSSRPAFWSSLGGILTGLAAVITAVGSLIAVIYQLAPAERATADADRNTRVAARESEAGAPATRQRDAPETATLTRARAANALEVGDPVLAPWADRCFYPGYVLEVGGATYLVKYAFGEETSVRKERVIDLAAPARAELRLNQPVLGKVKGVRERWVPSVIKDIRRDQYQLAFEEGAVCVDRSKPVWVSDAEILPRPR